MDMDIKGVIVKIIFVQLSLLAVSMIAGCNAMDRREASVAENCTGRGPITFAEFKKIEEGQTLDEVNVIFGCLGELRQGIVDEGPFTIEWTGGNGGSTSVLVIFINGRVTSEGIQKYGF